MVDAQCAELAAVLVNTWDGGEENEDEQVATEWGYLA